MNSAKFQYRVMYTYGPNNKGLFEVVIHGTRREILEKLSEMANLKGKLIASIELIGLSGVVKEVDASIQGGN